MKQKRANFDLLVFECFPNNIWSQRSETFDLMELFLNESLRLGYFLSENFLNGNGMNFNET